MMHGNSNIKKNGAVGSRLWRIRFGRVCGTS